MPPVWASGGRAVQPFIHHKGIDQPKTRMIESIGDRADRVKTQPVPQPDCAHIAGEHKVELLANGKSLASLPFTLTL